MSAMDSVAYVSFNGQKYSVIPPWTLQQVQEYFPEIVALQDLVKDAVTLLETEPSFALQAGHKYPGFTATYISKAENVEQIDTSGSCPTTVHFLSLVWSLNQWFLLFARSGSGRRQRARVASTQLPSFSTPLTALCKSCLTSDLKQSDIDSLNFIDDMPLSDLQYYTKTLCELLRSHGHTIPMPQHGPKPPPTLTFGVAAGPKRL